jgi:BlaI family penicillinase repressor
MSTDRPDAVKLGESETELMALLWAESPLGAAELAERARKQRGWSLTTVKTMLARLVEKGAVKARADGRRFLYSPAIARGEVAGAEAGRLVDRLFGGRVSPLVAHLAERRDLSADDLAELERIVRDLRK